MSDEQNATTLAIDLAGHFRGLRARWKAKGASTAQIASEILGSLYPSVQQLTALVDRLEQNAEFTAEKLDELTARIDSVEESMPAISVLIPEDSEQLLAALRLQTPVTDEQKKALAEAIELIEQITIEEEPEDDEEDAEEASAADAAPSPTAVAPPPPLPDAAPAQAAAAPAVEAPEARPDTVTEEAATPPS